MRTLLLKLIEYISYLYSKLFNESIVIISSKDNNVYAYLSIQEGNSEEHIDIARLLYPALKTDEQLQKATIIAISTIFDNNEHFDKEKFGEF